MTIGIAGDRTRLRDAASVSLFPLVVLGVVMVAFLTVWVPALLAADASPNPMVWLIDVVRGQAGWSAAATALAVGLVVLEAALCIKEVPGSYVWNGIIVLIIAVVNLRGLVETCLRFLHRR